MFRCRMNVSTMIFLMILQGATVVLFCGWYLQLSPCGSAPPNRKVHVLLLSSWRSGSSFLGQVFSQHPSVFYLMEPGWHVWHELPKSDKRLLRVTLRDLYRSLFHCDLSGLEGYLPENHNVSNLFMWSHSRAMCSPPVCPLTPRGELNEQLKCNKECRTLGLSGVKEACSSYSHVVYKAVRFFDLESLYPLFQDPSLDLRIIHLVRDPRAVLRSREQAPKAFIGDDGILTNHKKIPPADFIYEVMQEVCRSHVAINERAVVKPPPFIKGRYKLVRYEDMVLEPLAEINSMYEFVGLEMTRQLAEWIYKVTHGTGIGSRKEAFEITSRDAADVSQAWRTLMPFNKIKRVQDVCKGAMKVLGYKTVNNEKEQKKLDIDLLVPKVPYQFTWLPSKTEETENKTKYD